jgi:putative flippase GtrA
MNWRAAGSRWLKFNAVGALGVAVQLGALALLTRLGFHYLLATAVAVEAALLHNFAWHERFTWADRRRESHSTREITRRLLAFHAGNGTVSLAGNLGLMAWLTGTLHVAPLMANVVSIVACSIANFLIGDRLVFTEEKPASPEETVALAGMATAFTDEAPGGAADVLPGRHLIRHADEVPLGEGQKQQRRDRGERQPKSDVLPGEQRRERPQQVEHDLRGEGAAELLGGAPHVEADARQPI